MSPKFPSTWYPINLFNEVFEEWDSRVHWARASLGYTPDRNLDANHCEFYIDGTFGYRYKAGRFICDLLIVYVHIHRESLVHRHGAQILNVGSYVLTSHATSGFLVSARQDRIPLQLVFGNGHNSPPFLKEFAFFLDVRRFDGCIDRLWLKNGERNFLADDIRCFRLHGSWHNHEYYVTEDSPLFNQKKACRM